MTNEEIRAWRNETLSGIDSNRAHANCGSFRTAADCAKDAIKAIAERAIKNNGNESTEVVERSGDTA